MDSSVLHTIMTQLGNTMTPQDATDMVWYADKHGDGPSSRPNRVLVCAARTLNTTGQSRVTLSPR